MDCPSVELLQVIVGWERCSSESGNSETVPVVDVVS